MRMGSYNNTLWDITYTQREEPMFLVVYRMTCNMYLERVLPKEAVLTQKYVTDRQQDIKMPKPRRGTGPQCVRRIVINQHI